MEKKSKNSISKPSQFNKRYSKHLKIAGVSGIMVIIFSILFSNLLVYAIKADSLTTYQTNFYIGLIPSLLVILFFYGFFILGKVYNKKLLKITSLLIIILDTLVLFYQLLKQLIIGESVIEVTNIMGLFITGLFSIILFLTFILNILFGVGIIQLKDKIKYAKTAGILFFVFFSIHTLTSLLSFMFLPGGAAAARIASILYIPYLVVRGLSSTLLYLSLIILLFKASKQKTP